MTDSVDPSHEAGNADLDGCEGRLCGYDRGADSNDSELPAD